MKKNVIIRRSMNYPKKVFDKYAKIFEDSGNMMPGSVEIVKAHGSVCVVQIDGEAVGHVLALKYDEIEGRNRNLVITGVDRSRSEFAAVLEVDEEAAEEVSVSSESGSFGSIDKSYMQKIAKEKKIAYDSVVTRTRIMWENNVPENMIRQVLEQLPIGAREEPPYAEYINTGAFRKSCRSEMTFMIACGLLGQPVLLEAPKSAGKNVLTDNFAYVMGERCYRTNLDAQSTAEDFFGEKSTDDSAAKLLAEHPEYAEDYLRLTNGHLCSENGAELDNAVQYEILRTEMQSVRISLQKAPASLWADDDQGTLCIDEINAANPNLLIRLLNPLIDGDRLFSNPSCGIYRRLSKSHHVVGTMNKDYEGTFDLNEAVLSRFNIMKLEPPKDISATIAVKFGADGVKKTVPERTKLHRPAVKNGKLDESQIRQVSDLYSAFVRLVENGRVTSKVMNIRGIERAIELVCAFPDTFRFGALLEFTVLNGCEEDEIQLLKKAVKDAVEF